MKQSQKPTLLRWIVVLRHLCNWYYKWHFDRFATADNLWVPQSWDQHVACCQQLCSCHHAVAK